MASRRKRHAKPPTAPMPVISTADAPFHAPARDWLHIRCESGHDWQSIGGCNAACHDWCACSVPVNVCKRCGDCDYGENEEANQVRTNCGLSRATDNYNPRRDLAGSIAEGFEAIRERVAQGGPGWERKS